MASPHTNHCQHYDTLEKPLPLVALGLNSFNHSWTYQVSYVFPPTALTPIVLSKFLLEHITCQFILLILVAPCWMEAPWLPTVLNMLEDVPWHCPLIKDLIINVMGSQVLKGLPYLHVTLCCSEICVVQT